ncbi:hypothetical protein JW848_11410 [Candidatus Bipolaricaulota bacterium]|nr:hypothetical protein [Candidatus Bipolaricaulota bacterium]
MPTESALEQLRASVQRTVRSRLVTLSVFCVIASVVILATDISYLNPLFYAPFAWLALTFLFSFLIRRRQNTRELQWAHISYFLLEAALITVLVHLMGGAEWIGVIFYMPTVVTANYFLSRRHSIVLTASVILLYTGLVLLECVGVLAHRTLFSSIEGDLHRSLGYVLPTILAGSLAIYVVISHTVRSFNEYYWSKQRTLARREADLARLSRQLLDAQDEERRRIARQLHDEVGQSLAAIKLHAAVLPSVSPNDRLKLEDVVDHAIRQTRDLTRSLRPPLLDELGLEPAIRELGRMIGEAANLQVETSVDIEHRLPEGTEWLIYTVISEALRNVERHAHASKASITIECRRGCLYIEVKDNGIGFNPSHIQGLGLRSAFERLDAVGGRLLINASPGEGTELIAEVPYEPNSHSHRG